MNWAGVNPANKIKGVFFCITFNSKTISKLRQFSDGYYSVGAKVDLHLEPEDAFGDFDENLLFLEPLALFPKDIEEGLTIEGNALPAGCNPDAPRNVLYTITEIYPDHLVLDGNHPLSGIALRISLKVNHVRLATDQEQEAGTCGTGFFKIEIGDTPGSAGGLLQ